MNFTLNQAIQIHPLCNSMILAGKDGLNRRIDLFGILDAPDSVNFVKPNEFVMTTGYILKDDINAQVMLIKELVKKDACALGIKIHRYIDNLMPEALNYADENGFPILALPNEFSWYELSSLIVKNPIGVNVGLSELLNSRNEFLFKLLLEDITDNEKTLFQANQLRIKLQENYVVAVGEVSLKDTSSKMKSVQDNLFERLHNSFSLIENKYGILVGFAKFQELFLMLPAESKLMKENLHLSSKNKLNLVRNEWEKLFPEFCLSFGIGKFYPGLIGLKPSYREAITTLKLGKKIYGPGTTTSFNDLGLYRFLNDPHVIPELENYIKDYIIPIIEYDKENNSDLLFTLKTFFKCGRVLRKCAQTMYVHHNTIRYRLELIEQICNISMDVPDNLLNLEVALKFLPLVSELLPEKSG